MLGSTWARPSLVSFVAHQNIFNMANTNFHVETTVSKDDLLDSYKDKFGVVYSSDGSKLLYVSSPGWKSSTKKYSIKPGTRIICDRAFKIGTGTSLLKTIEIPNSVTHIGKYAFESCSNVNSINLPESIIYIGDGAFENCVNLREPLVIHSNVADIGANPFPSNSSKVECLSPFFELIDNSLYSKDLKLLIAVLEDSEKSITIPNTVVKIGDSAIKWKHKVETVFIPDSVVQIGNNAFMWCSLKNIIIPSSVNQIGENIFGGSYPETLVCESPYFVLENKTLYTKDKTKMIFCKDIYSTSFTIPESVTHIGGYAFYYNSIKQINIPESVTHIGNHAFEGSEGLKELVIPKSVNHIGKSAFRHCDSLTKFTIQKSISEIDWEIICEPKSENAFFDCPSLKEIHIPDISDEVFAKLFTGSSGVRRC